MGSFNWNLKCIQRKIRKKALEYSSKKKKPARSFPSKRNPAEFQGKKNSTLCCLFSPSPSSELRITMCDFTTTDLRGNSRYGVPSLLVKEALWMPIPAIASHMLRTRTTSFFQTPTGHSNYSRATKTAADRLVLCTAETSMDDLSDWEIERGSVGNWKYYMLLMYCVQLHSLRKWIEIKDATDQLKTGRCSAI